MPTATSKQHMQQPTKVRLSSVPILPPDIPKPVTTSNFNFSALQKQEVAALTTTTPLQTIKIASQQQWNEEFWMTAVKWRVVDALLMAAKCNCHEVTSQEFDNLSERMLPQVYRASFQLRNFHRSDRIWIEVSVPSIFAVSFDAKKFRMRQVPLPPKTSKPTQEYTVFFKGPL